MERIVFASGNKGKIREIGELFGDLGVTIVPQSELGIPSVEETGSTFTENALLKARHAAAHSGLPAIADDSGLSVDALDGRPGVRSARFAGPNASDEQNIDKLLRELSLTAAGDRAAAFHCAAVYVDASLELIAEGEWRGLILGERGGSGGFGYDPVFYDQTAGQCAALMTAEQKNAVSHRGQAFRQLLALIRERRPAT